MNPPYGMRMGEESEIEVLYRALPDVLRRLKTWSHYILSARGDLEQLVGQNCRSETQAVQRADRLYLLPVLRPTASREDASECETASGAACGFATASFRGVAREAARQAEEFANRLRKRRPASSPLAHETWHHVLPAV